MLTRPEWSAGPPNPKQRQEVADADLTVFVDVAGAVRRAGIGTRSPIAEDREKVIDPHLPVAEADNGSNNPAISSEGGYVTFGSNAKLLPEDTDTRPDIYAYDRVTGELERISISDTGGNTNGFNFKPAITPDGRTPTRSLPSRSFSSIETAPPRPRRYYARRWPSAAACRATTTGTPSRC